MLKYLKFTLFFAVLLISKVNSSQIKIQTLHSDESLTTSYLFDTVSPTRILRSIQNWSVYTENKSDIKKTVTLPALFNGSDELVFETNLQFTREEILTKNIKLVLLGVNYSVEIFINNLSIFKRAGGEVPFEIEIPKDILKFDTVNKLKLKVSSKLDPVTTIPTLQRFLFPKKNSGIVRNIYLEFSPLTHFDNLTFDYELDQKLLNADVNLLFDLKNLSEIFKDSGNKEPVKIKINLHQKNSKGKDLDQEYVIAEGDKKNLTRNYRLIFPNPVLWSPSEPNLYTFSMELHKGKLLIDKISRDIGFYSLNSSQEGLSFNNEAFTFKGTTYILNESLLLNRTAFEKIKEDLTLVKNTGFNAVRFSKSFPNPAAIKLCQELGLISLIELPINSIPEEILSQHEFKLRAALRFSELTKRYKQFSNTILFGLGSSYLSDSDITLDFLNHIIEQTGKNNLYYASFVGIPEKLVEGIDLYGIEVFSTPIERLTQALQQQNEILNSRKIFFSEITYPDYLGSSSGYLVKNSSEAQAKYFENVIDLSVKNKIEGFFINTFINYSGDFNSLYAGFDKNNQYKIGILKANPNLNSITYKVIKAKLNNDEKVTVPIGSAKDENKLFFILVALGLSVVMALLINSKKKFREDCTRALIRPYNFYADIRDHRILSGIHTIILSFIEVGSISLFFTIILYYVRTNLLFEKLLLSFGEPKIISYFSSMAWNPEKSFLYLFIVLLIVLFLFAIIIKAASFFVRTRISFSSIFFMVIWALLPFTILLPVELIFYKILASGDVNTFVLVFLLVFMIWIFLRIMKGIHVVFDTRPFPVYFYGITFILLFFFSFFLYYQLHNSSVYYLLNSLRQYQLMSF